MKYLEKKIKNGTANFLHLETHEDLQRRIQVEQTRLQYCKDHNDESALQLSKVKMASAHAVRDRVLDWANCEAIYDRVGENKVSSLTPKALQVLTVPKILNQEKLGDEYSLMGRTHAEQISFQPRFPGQKVFKVGRTIGLTVGTMRPVNVMVSIE